MSVIPRELPQKRPNKSVQLIHGKSLAPTPVCDSSVCDFSVVLSTHAVKAEGDIPFGMNLGVRRTSMNVPCDNQTNAIEGQAIIVQCCSSLYLQDFMIPGYNCQTVSLVVLSFGTEQAKSPMRFTSDVLELGEES